MLYNMQNQSTSEEQADSLDLAGHVNINVHQVFDDYAGEKVQFIRVEVTNINPAIEAIVGIVADTSWVNDLVDILDRASLIARAQPTIEKLSEDLNKAIKSKATADVGEYIVSVVARHTIEAICGYRALPLAEVIKEQISGNPGFDYHHEHSGLILIFGEAKYKTGLNAYGDAFSQIVKHIGLQKDVKEANDMARFLSDESKTNFLDGKKGFSAAFSTSRKSFDTATLIRNVKANANFKKLVKHDALVIVAVDIND